jgi:outer membrane receptor for ferrienterochelin and colicin
LFVRDSEFRLSDGRVVVPQPGAAFSNALHGPSRGVEVSLQRRSANGLSGWVSYAFGHARLRDDATGLEFDSDFDQRHTFNAYASLRVTNTLNLSTKYRYGSNLPIPGFYREEAGAFYLAEDRNRVRTPVYSRLDLRAARAFFYTRWKMTIYAEVSNVFDRDHYRYSGDGDIDLRTGQVFLERDKLFPILPAAGVTVEF